MNSTIRKYIIGGVLVLGFLIVLLAWPTTRPVPTARIPKHVFNKPQQPVTQASKRFPCVSTMDPTYFKRFTELAHKYDQTPFDHLVIPRLRYHFDERFVSKFKIINSLLFVLYIGLVWPKNPRQQRI